MADETKELGNLLGSRLREQEDMRRSSTHPSNINTIYLFPTETLGQLDDWNLVNKTKDYSNTNSFILGHPVNGVLGVANGLGGGQIVLGDDGNIGSATEVVRRRWTWKTQADLSLGTITPNLTINNGDIRFK